MRRAQGKTSWLAVVYRAVLLGAVFFLVMTLGNRYVIEDDFDWDALGPAIGLTILWIGFGAVERQGWMSSAGRRSREEDN